MLKSQVCYLSEVVMYLGVKIVIASKTELPFFKTATICSLSFMICSKWIKELKQVEFKYFIFTITNFHNVCLYYTILDKNLRENLKARER